MKDGVADFFLLLLVVVSMLNFGFFCLGSCSWLCGIVVGDGVTGQPAFVEVSPNDDDEFNEPFLTVVVSFVCACCLCFMDVNPFGSKSAIEELVPADLMLAFNKKVVNFGIVCGGDMGCLPRG